MTLPSFLIVGAMKAGTTTLFQDLETHPRIYAPIDKEPSSLTSDEILTDKGRRAYERLFARAPADAVCFEASTDYTKLPRCPGVPDRAMRVLGPELKVIYIIRDPVKRTISHHAHEYSHAFCSADADAEIQGHARFIDYSCYAMQIEPWLRTFGEDNVRVLQLEEYSKQRGRIVGLLEEWLGLENRGELVDPSRVANSASNRVVHNGLSRRIADSPLYRRCVRPILADRLRVSLRDRLSSPPPAPPAPPSQATLDLIRERTGRELDRLRALVDLDWCHAGARDAQARA